MKLKFKTLTLGSPPSQTIELTSERQEQIRSRAYELYEQRGKKMDAI
jgi:hypothetical protein